MGGANHFPWGKYLPLPSKQCHDIVYNPECWQRAVALIRLLILRFIMQFELDTLYSCMFASCMFAFNKGNYLQTQCYKLLKI
jgi:hypothetical protein